MAAVEKVRLDLQHTVVRAPTSGVVAQSDKLLVRQAALVGVSMVASLPGYTSDSRPSSQRTR